MLWVFPSQRFSSVCGGADGINGGRDQRRAKFLGGFLAVGVPAGYFLGTWCAVLGVLVVSCGFLWFLVVSCGFLGLWRGLVAADGFGWYTVLVVAMCLWRVHVCGLVSGVADVFLSADVIITRNQISKGLLYRDVACKFMKSGLARPGLARKSMEKRYFYMRAES